ncbi:hypothetical protein LSAT2_013728 [Lamellibrachia satsuma]|nr:hypothetical protein LSAT2_013728 [Lamellibrachia satsuma]
MQLLPWAVWIARMPMAGAKTTSLTSIDVPSRARLPLTLFLTLLFHLLCSTEAPGTAADLSHVLVTTEEVIWKISADLNGGSQKNDTFIPGGSKETTGGKTMVWWFGGDVDSTRGIAVDNVRCYFYWSDTAQLKIRRSSLVWDHFGNNDTIVDIVDDVKAPAIAVDADTSRVYFVNYNEKCVEVVSWDGRNRTKLISEIHGKPRGIALDIPRRLVFISTRSQVGIRIYNLDSFELMANLSNVGHPLKLVINNVTKELCWATKELHFFVCAGYDDVQLNGSRTVYNISDVASMAFKDNIMFSAEGTKVCRYRKNGQSGSNKTTCVDIGTQTIDIALLHGECRRPGVLVDVDGSSDADILTPDVRLLDVDGQAKFFTGISKYVCQSLKALCGVGQVHCGSPFNVTHASYSMPGDDMVGENVTYTCNHGYKRKEGERFSRCQLDGKWAKPSLKCEEVHCGSPLNVTNASYLMRNDDIVGENVTYTCKNGYKRKEGEGFSRCQLDGKWTKPSLKCEEVHCGSPLNVTNASYSMRNDDMVGENVTYTCNHGYKRMEGEGFSLCQLDGKWTKPSLKCEEVHCGSPLNVTNASYSMPDDDMVGENVTYTCKYGYKRKEGEGFSRCQLDGKWTKPSLKCEANGFLAHLSALEQPMASLLTCRLSSSQWLPCSLVGSRAANGFLAHLSALEQPMASLLTCRLSSSQWLPCSLVGSRAANGFLAHLPSRYCCLKFACRLFLKALCGVGRKCSIVGKEKFTNGDFADLALCYQDDSCKGFANNAEQRDTAVVVTVAAVTLVRVQGSDDGVKHILRHYALLPALAEKFMEFECFGYAKVVVRAQVEQTPSVFINVPSAIVSNACRPLINVVTDPGIEVPQQDQVFRVGDAVDEGVEFFIEQVFDFRGEQNIGAYMLSKFTEPDAVDRPQDAF